ncbi:hypothetical protein QBC44DRAFT_367001 [Cladorrhinum sp. PSN332]|nr:hypothetical protein QBC44DRAFT_367001 [Cladorrhinum sp. PSN332]
MSHRHSCERCRRQKVRCLRDPENVHKPSPGQSIQRCTRCAKAGTACVYNLRLRTKRPGSNAKGNTTAGNQKLPSAVKKEPSSSPFNPVEEETSPYQMEFDSFNWDQLSMFSPTQLGMGEHPPNTADAAPFDLDMNNSTVPALPTDKSGVLGDGQWWSGVPTPPSSSPKLEVRDDHIPAVDSLQRLTAQATTVSGQAMAATRHLLSPGSAPPTVLSVHVNEAFEGTKALVRIITDIMAMSSPCNSGDRSDGSCKSLEIGGLVLTTLACHQHLLAFFRAICDSIERCVESGADDSRNGSFLSGDGPPPTAQFTMVLQLLVHLSNRLDKSLFPARPPSPVSSEEPEEAIVPGTADISSIAQTLVRAMPNHHLKLRQTILQLQARMERLESF